MTKSNNEWVPEVGKKYQHHSGRVYEVTGFANQHTEYPDKFPVMILYRNIDNGTEWARALDEWLLKFEPFKTEAEKRRNEMVDSLSGVYIKPGEYVGREYAEAIIEAGWINPRPLSDEVIDRIRDSDETFIGCMKKVEAYIRGER